MKLIFIAIAGIVTYFAIIAVATVFLLFTGAIVWYIIFDSWDILYNLSPTGKAVALIIAIAIANHIVEDYIECKLCEENDDDIRSKWQ